jgi:mono/diheme cytochrome c family protein
MTHNKISTKLLLLPLLVVVLLSACVKDTSKPGYEFMPDMYRSPSLEIYVSNPYFEDSLNARIPVKGTMPRGHIAFDYVNTVEDYIAAGNDLLNPLEISEDNLESGKKLFQMFCAHCHGTNGDGKGSISHPVYSAIPSYADDLMIRRTGGTMKDLKAGNIYHAIYYGLNAMGPHNSQLTNDERWLITMYVQELQKVENN